MTHEMKVQPTFFDKIKSGEKIYEIRLNDEKRQKIKVGDEITFKKEPDLIEKLTVQVVKLTKFKTLDEMAEKLPLHELGFHKLNADEVVEVYHHFYTPDEEKKYGVLAIKIKLN